MKKETKNKKIFVIKEASYQTKGAQSYQCEEDIYGTVRPNYVYHR